MNLYKAAVMAVLVVGNLIVGVALYVVSSKIADWVLGIR